jgi:hypothetical protein
MLVNFGVIKDFKSTEKYAVLKHAIAKAKVSFSSDTRKLTSYSIIVVIILMLIVAN